VIAMRVRPVLASILCLASCSGGGGDPNSIKGTSGDFVVLRTEPQNNGKLFLNEPIRIDFSNPVDLGTANLTTVSLQVFDIAGNPLQEQTSGEFRIATAAGDAEPGRRLEFVPKFPTNDTYDNGGFRPGRRYVVQLVRGDQRSTNVLEDVRGKPLANPVSFQFQTAEGTTPSQLFRDTKVGGPRRVGFTIAPADQRGVALNLLGQQAVEAVLSFDQPLDPHSSNVPVRFDPDPTKRDIGLRGRIFLEYDDPDPSKGRNTWVPAQVSILSNSLDGSKLAVRPIGVLPNNAFVRVIVENTLQDMAGESNVADASYNRIFAEFRTRTDYEQQFDAVVDDFDTSAGLDLNAPFLEPLAQVRNGAVQANFAFEGSATILDYEPTTREVVLNTDFTQITPKGAPPINVSGGVFEFRHVTIPQGVTVRGAGTRPMVWLVTGDFTVNGELTVTGGDGARVDTLNSANFPAPGGVGSCGGGNGGAGSPSATGRDQTGQSGFGPNQVPGGGGGGGLLSPDASCNRGSGGGGGSLATQGDPYFKAKNTSGSAFIQQRGVGGYGCTGGSGSATRRLQGGAAGPLAFKDARIDNDFWGSAVNVQRQIRITGEIPNPVAGAGGGGGGDNAQGAPANWINDNRGGGGGAGGGILIVKALGRILVGSGGMIRAEGGNGGGGEAAGGNTQGGGGGGGSGGMVILMAGTAIHLQAHGETYQNNDFSFSVSADGGTGTQGRFGGAEWLHKYTAPINGATRDANPSGALGGLGIVQLMAPSGSNQDSTNTVLDDNIKIFRGTNEMTGAEKTRYLAWRGFPDETGRYVDDLGNPTYHDNLATRDNEGDIRPAPTLLPAPYGDQSRARSRYIDTGASVRRPLTAPDGAPRGIVENTTTTPKLVAGPTPYFAGTNQGSSYPGYVDYIAQGTSSVVIHYPAPAVRTDIVAMSATGAYEGQAAYVVDVTSGSLGTIPNQYAHYTAELLNSSDSVLASYRILGHTDRRMFLNVRGAQLPTQAVRVQVVAKLFELATGGVEGLGPVYIVNNKPVPKANVKIGFAFHQDATKAKTSGTDPLRFPQQVGTFTYDLNSDAAREAIRQLKAAYVQWDLLFNLRFSEDPATGNTNQQAVLDPSQPRPEIRFLRIPYRF
jgi:hypothetical protein